VDVADSGPDDKRTLVAISSIRPSYSDTRILDKFASFANMT
jgi:hypothetical protein